MKQGTHLGVIIIALTGLAACGGTSVLDTASLTAPAALGHYSSSHTESTAEIYSRVARGAKACWLAPGKPLHKGFVFEGELAPESEGGAAEVAVHVRTPNQPNPRGGKVFVVSLTREGQGTSLMTESRRIPDSLAQALRADVARWARTGAIECSDITLPESQGPGQGLASAEPKSDLKKSAATTGGRAQGSSPSSAPSKRPAAQK